MAGIKLRGKGETMPLIKGEDIEPRWFNIIGSVQCCYPIDGNNDIQLFTHVQHKSENDKDWEWQKHSHPDFEEYTYITKGKGKAVVGAETYELEEGDLLITPRGVAHKFLGDLEMIFFHCKCNVYGRSCHGKHPVVAHEKPWRQDPKDQAGLLEVGKYIEIDPLERTEPLE
jgi:mannose-6-phosphate isomerase-like protein (cupin superfamily)